MSPAEILLSVSPLLPPDSPYDKLADICRKPSENLDKC